MKIGKKQKIFAILCAVGMVFCGCSEKDEQVEYEDLLVKEETPLKETISNTGEFIGTIATGETVSVVAKASGEIKETYFKEGDVVSEGDLLFEVDDTQAQQGIKSAQAAYALSKTNADRMLGSSLDAQAISATSSYKNAEIGVDNAYYNYYNTCDAIGDTKKSIEDMNSSKDGMKNQKADLQKQLEALAASAPTDPKIAELKSAIGALETQIATIEKSIASTESKKSQLENSVHTYENAIAQAEVGEAAATATLNLTVTKILSEAVSSASATVNQAQVAVDNAKAALDNYQIKSPVSGVIEQINIEKYGLAQAGSPAYVIATDQNKVVNFYVSESNITNVSLNQEIRLEYAGSVYTGKITEIEDSIDANTGMFLIEASVDGGENALFAGSSVKVLLETATAENAITVPLDAIYYEDEQAYVYVDIDGIATKQYVETGIYNEERIVITSGLTGTEKVITSWSARLKDGEKVNGAN